ncbi:SH3 domain-binding glutamic acid-rich protein-like [Bombina bombina]|uniref:SH3 domain-binding glutamic acid-rich protein-like n=1 Tax=Bombina bombina TaxID=8345 RepID=UPI00235A5C93|nr:SH3 domain-binding glutamic acid-rich protein-like [Bombina bombina]
MENQGPASTKEAEEIGEREAGEESSNGSGSRRNGQCGIEFPTDIDHKARSGYEQGYAGQEGEESEDGGQGRGASRNRTEAGMGGAPAEGRTGGEKKHGETGKEGQLAEGSRLRIYQELSMSSEKQPVFLFLGL